jgi:hypothetical protein
MADAKNPVIGQQAAGYRLRPWEVVERANFCLHDCLGGVTGADAGSAALVVERNGGGVLRGLVTSQDECVVAWHGFWFA